MPKACLPARLPHPASLPSFIALALREPVSPVPARSPCMRPAAAVTRRVWIRQDRRRPAPTLFVSGQLMIWALPDLQAASSRGTGAAGGAPLLTRALAVSACFCLLPGACIWGSLARSLAACCCGTSRPGGSGCSWNLLQAACALRYPVNFPRGLALTV